MFNRKDSFYKKAKEEGYISRAAYKLLEIEKKYKIFRQNSNILDLGCAPGGWLQVAAKFVTKGSIVGVDILDVNPLGFKNIEIIKDDIFDVMLRENFKNRKFDLILSDMSPNLSGIKHADYYRSFELCNVAFTVVQNQLDKNGNFVIKIFRGVEFDQFVKSLKPYFSEVRIFKPQSSRDTSAEIYIVSKNYLKSS